MKTIKAKMKSLTRSYGEKDYDILEYFGQECILINQNKRNFTFESENGKIYVFISNEKPYFVKEKYGDSEVEIMFDDSNYGTLNMIKKIANQKMKAKFPVKKEIFKCKNDLIHIKYQLLDEFTRDILTEVEVFIEIGG